MSIIIPAVFSVLVIGLLLARYMMLFAARKAAVEKYVEQSKDLNAYIVAPASKRSRVPSELEATRLFYVQVGMTTLVLICALYVIVSPMLDPRDKHWGYGAVGTIMGFWLKK